MAMEYLSWWPTSSWMSPGAALFLLCNVLIGAIVVTSRGEQQRGRAAAAASTRRLCRSASSMVLDPLRSFSMFSVHTLAVEEDYHHSPSLELQAEEEAAVEEPAIAMALPASVPVAAPSATSQSAMEVAGTGGDKPVIVSSEEAQTQCPAWQGHAHQEAPSSTAVVASAEAITTAAAERPATVAESSAARESVQEGSGGSSGGEGGAERAGGGVHPAVPRGPQAAAPQLHHELHPRAPPRRWHGTGRRGVARGSRDREGC
nr:unnamed protein product [Digitaria exilis]CAB3482879.1 unnamed protein product [Digitaria exilis]